MRHFLPWLPLIFRAGADSEKMFDEVFFTLHSAIYAFRRMPLAA